MSIARLPTPPPPPLTTSSTTTALTQTLQLHENQRFWIGQGFTGTLLPNDRGRFSLTDGSQSWKSAQEAADNVLGLGWQWVEEDNDETANQKEYAGFGVSLLLESSDGWMYARDFSPSAVRDAQTRRKAWHWVRFRTLERKAVWTGAFDNDNNAVNAVHCDSKVVTSLAQILLEVLVYTVIVQDGIKQVSKGASEEKAQFKQATVLRIKSNLILHLLHFPKARNAEHEQPVDAFLQMERLTESLTNYAESERRTGLQSVFAAVPPYAKRFSDIPDFTKLCHTVSETHFGLGERFRIAMWMIQTNLDPNGQQMQCHGRDGCTNKDTCIYVWLPCPNAGCDQVMSRLYLESHIQEECNFQIVQCKDCGDALLRHELEGHLAFACPHRNATCPFARLGCLAVLTAQDIPDHVQDSASAHLLLSLQRMVQYEAQFRQLRDRIESLELAHVNVQNTNQTQQKQAAQNIAALERTVAALQKRVNAVERQGHRGLQQLKTQLEKSHVK